MPKGSGGKKSASRNGRNSISHLTTKSDFTIYDFAHSDVVGVTVKSERLRKGDTNAWCTEAKSLCGKLAVTDISLAWYDKDLSDIEAELLNGNQDGSDIEDQEKAAVSKVRCSKDIKSNFGRVYPIDIWFLLSEYVFPEDVSAFAAICPYTHLVVHSAKFWYNLYRRFYDSTAQLPPSLALQSIERVHGLKSRVVRSLYCMYPPFQSRLCHSIPFESDPDCLEGTRCVLMWYQKVKQMWHFFFKFERSSKFACQLSGGSHKTDSVMSDANVSFNPEERNVVLQAVSTNFIALPMVVGEVLIKSFISVGHGMRSHRLKLVFNPNYIHVTRAALGNGTTVILDPVLSIHILHWWDPKYPCH